MGDTATGQLKVLRSLKQGPAAWLLGLSDASTLRAQASAPRNADGSYNAQELVAWQARRAPRPALSDGDVERLLVLVDHVEPDLQVFPGVVPILDELVARYGDATLTALGELLVARWREVDALHAADWDSRRRAAAADGLKTAVVCERCKRLRCGNKWVKGAPPPQSEVLLDACPRCSPSD